MSLRAIIAETALLPSGWADRVRIDFDADGAITSVGPLRDAREAEHVAGIVVPGMPNLHCHAFQRAMAGLTERAGPAADDFWSWRDVMYRFLGQLSPEQVEAVAAQLYVEMLKSGYTSVAEFHYLHNDPAGQPYRDRAELSHRIVNGARQAGMRLTLLPVLYQTGNFGGAPPTPGQKRFLLGDDAYAELVTMLYADYGRAPDIRLGIAPHSLRAVPPYGLKRARRLIDGLDPAAPIHIHVAEQTKEVEDCLAWSGLRPVDWLLRNVEPNARWTLIHATHMTAEEMRGLAASGAAAGLCPTTEADLGDGFFPLPDFLAAEGRFGIGSDSNVGVAPAEELRWLEYGHRLQRRKRNLAPAETGASIGARLWNAALAGGAQALAAPIGRIATGARADFLVLDPDHPALAGRRGDLALDSLVFAGGTAAIRHVMVGGAWKVRDHRHLREAEIAAHYRRAVATLQ